MRATCLGAVVLACLLVLPAFAQGPECAFFSPAGEETSYFRLQLPQQYCSTTKTKTLVRLRAVSPEVFLIYPREIQPYERSSAFIGKYRGAGDFQFQVEAFVYGEREVTAKREEFSVSFPARGEPMTDSVMNEFLAAQVTECESVLRREPDNSFYQYVRLQAPKRGDIAAVARSVPMGRWRRILDREVDMFSITTGALAIQESLQLEEMTRPTTSRADDKPAVLVSSLEGPTIRSHPFEEMLRGRAPLVFEAARLAPQDFYYAHFRTLEDFLRVLDFSHAWGGHFLRIYAASGRDDRLFEKTRKQLLPKVDPATRALLGRAIRDVTIIGSDPFFLSGTDVTVLFRMTAKPILQAYWAQRIAETAVVHPDLVTGSFGHGGVVVSSATVPSGEIRSFFALLDDWAIFSNSRRAIERVLDVADLKTPSLAEAADFRYMRTVFPAPPDVGADADDPSERGFIYLSDAHIRHLVGPALKLKEQRRMRCVNHLKMIEHAALLFRIENQRSPESLDELIARKYVNADLLRCPDGGEYGLRPSDFTAVCSVHNQLGYLTPNLDRSLDIVTDREANEYKNFVRRYNNYWRTYFDPIGIRIATRTGISFETCILPLIENSMYNNLRDICGGEAVNLARSIRAPGTAISIAGRINAKPYLERFNLLHRLDEELGGHAAKAIGDSIGSTFSFHLLDAEPIISFDANRFLGEVIRWRTDTDLLWLPLLAGANLPAYVGVEVKDREALEGVLGGLEAFLARQASEQQRSRFALRGDFYHLPDYRGKKMTAVGIEFLSFKARIFYSMIGDTLYIANRAPILRQIADVAAENKPAAEFPGHVRIAFGCANWKELSPHLELRWAEMSRKACFRNFVPLGVLFQAKDEGVPMDEFSWRSDGRIYACPDGGAYAFDGGDVVCSVHGSLAAPRQDVALPAENALAKMLRELHAIRLSLQFTAEGLLTRLDVERP